MVPALPALRLLAARPRSLPLNALGCLPQPSACPLPRSVSTTPCLYKKSKPNPAKPSTGKSKASDSIGTTDAGADVAGVLERTKGKMGKAVEWAKVVVYDGVERGRGRVSPALLDGVKVALPDSPSTPLNTVASVTVKSNTLFIEVWDTDATKHVESALHKANMPGLSPQRIDGNTLKIPVSRPTAEQRAQILRNLSTTIESAKQQLRTARSEGMKALGGRGAGGTEDVQEMADGFGGELDGVLSKARKEFEKA